MKQVSGNWESKQPMPWAGAGVRGQREAGEKVGCGGAVRSLLTFGKLLAPVGQPLNPLWVLCASPAQ